MTAPLRAASPIPRRNSEPELDPASFEEFYAEHHRRLFVALCLVTGSRHEAEEIAQEAFVRLWQRWDRISEVRDPVAYLFRAAMNVFRNRYRRALVAVRRSLSIAPPADDLAAVEDRDEVARLLAGLTPQQRAAIVLTVLLGFTAEEAGDVLRIRPSTVRVLTWRARTTLKERTRGTDR